MKEQMIDLLQNYYHYAFFISIGINVLVSLFGFLPSVFITAANLVVFGFWEGTLVSFIGEGLGAVVSFVIYRKGLAKVADTKMFHRPMVRRLLEVEGMSAFSLVFSLRLLPFVPSGVVTFLAAIGRMSLVVFAISSTLGKLPALLLEAYSVYSLIQWNWQGKLVMAALAGMLCFAVLKNIYHNKGE